MFGLLIQYIDNFEFGSPNQKQNNIFRFQAKIRLKLP